MDTPTIFTCRQCGFCCHGETTVSLDEEDQRRMVDALGLERTEVERDFWKITDGIVQMKTVDGHCIFYRDGCTVYRGRPWRCRQWPLVPALLNGEENYQAIGSSCPGLTTDMDYETFKKLLAELIGPPAGDR